MLEGHPGELLYTFLDSIKVDYLYLVGDIIDVWALRQKWHWPPQYNEVIGHHEVRTAGHPSNRGGRSG